MKHSKPKNIFLSIKLFQICQLCLNKKELFYDKYHGKLTDSMNWNTQPNLFGKVPLNCKTKFLINEFPISTKFNLLEVFFNDKIFPSSSELSYQFFKTQVKRSKTLLLYSNVSTLFLNVHQIVYESIFIIEIFEQIQGLGILKNTSAKKQGHRISRAARNNNLRIFKPFTSMIFFSPRVTINPSSRLSLSPEEFEAYKSLVLASQNFFLCDFQLFLHKITKK